MVRVSVRPRKISRSKAARQTDQREEGVLQAAILHLITHHGMFLVPTAARQLSIRDLPVWIITVTLRFDVGDEGYVGDLLYDGERFTFLTDQAVMDQRARQIAQNPEALRRWNEYRASALHSFWTGESSPSPTLTALSST